MARVWAVRTALGGCDLSLAGRYVLYRFLTVWVGTLGFFTITVCCRELCWLLEHTLSGPAPFATSLGLLQLRLPGLLLAASFFATPLTVGMVFGQMLSDGELMAFASIGVSIARLTWPVMAFVTLHVAFLAWACQTTIPRARIAARHALEAPNWARAAARASGEDWICPRPGLLLGTSDGADGEKPGRFTLAAIQEGAFPVLVTGDHLLEEASAYVLRDAAATGLDVLKARSGSLSFTEARLPIVRACSLPVRNPSELAPDEQTLAELRESATELEARGEPREAASRLAEATSRWVWALAPLLALLFALPRSVQPRPHAIGHLTGQGLLPTAGYLLCAAVAIVTLSRNPVLRLVALRGVMAGFLALAAFGFIRRGRA